MDSVYAVLATWFLFWTAVVLLDVAGESDPTLRRRGYAVAATQWAAFVLSLVLGFKRG